MRISAPSAYFLTFRTYGTWLHGDARGSQHHRQTTYRSPTVTQSARWEAAERARMRGPAVRLEGAARERVERVIAEVCDYNAWVLQAVSARTNHVHAVVAAPTAPEAVLRSLKAWATRRLVESGLFERSTRLWSRHGSTVYLWTEESRVRAIWYVEHEQDA